jgi:NitT/TauT family transport system ATP-binding protein
MQMLNTEEAPLLKLTGVEKTFQNGTQAVAGLDLTINKREFVSLLGPSGCGKSTALRIIAGLSTMTAGSLEWADGTPKPGDISFVFQESTLMPWTSVWENVYLPLKLRGQSKEASQSQVSEALKMVGLSRFSSSYPRELSGGMKMRASIARALVTRPRVMLMDEPFAALDEMTRIKLNNDLQALWQEHGWTIVFVTHSVYESVYISNRIVVMAARPGRIIGDRKIAAPYPRDEAFRTSAPYNEYCKEVSSTLHSALDSSAIDH